MRITRAWKKATANANAAQWTIWDRGDELWELKGGEIRHFSVIHRVKNEDVITEVLQLLKESPIPLEAIRQQIQGWQVEEVKQTLLQQKKEGVRPLRQGPAFLPDTPEDASSHSPPQMPSPEPSLQRVKKEHTKKNTLQPAPLTQSHHDSQKQLAPNSQEEQSEPPSYTLPNELWSSLSQWIPPNALFQPSLHHQAFLESSGTQGSSYPGQKDSEKNLQPSQAERQYARRAQHSRPYRPRPSGPPKQVSSGPLFI